MIIHFSFNATSDGDLMVRLREQLQEIKQLLKLRLGKQLCNEYTSLNAQLTIRYSNPTTPVPRLWIQNSAVSTTMVMGTTKFLAAGVTTSSPSTALSTEIAGVMTPSPKKPCGSRTRPSSERRRPTTAKR
jgi:hypothetical protein